MENMDLGLRRSPASVEGPEHELPSGGGSSRICIDEGGDGDRCEAEASPCTTAVITGGGTNPVEQSLDEFNVVDKYALLCNSEGFNQSMERLCSPPCNGNAAWLDTENSTGMSVPVWNEMDNDNGDGLGVEEDEGRSSALEGDPAVGASNKGPVEESDSPCLSPSRIMVGCELQTSSHIVVGVEGGIVQFKGDEGCKECEAAVVSSSRSTTVIGVEGGIAYFDRDKDCDGCEFAIVRQSSLTTDCSSMNSSSKLVDEFHCNFLPQDNKATSISYGTKWIEETCGNSSECVQSINNKDDSEVVPLPCVLGHCLEQAIEKPSRDVLVEQTGEKEADAPTHSEERDTPVFTHSEERETVVPVHFENEICQALSIEGESCDLVRGLPGIVASSRTSKELASLQPSHLSNASVDCPSCLHSVSDDKGDTVAVSISSTCCGTAADCCTQADNGGKGDVKSGTVLVITRRNPKRAASSRNNLCITKCDPPTRLRSSAKKRRHAVNICALLSCGSFKGVTKKRCHSWKRARVSVWGELGNLLELFKHNDELSQSKKKGSKKRRCCGAGRRRLTDRRGGSSHRPRAKCTVSKNRVILPDEMDQQLTFATNSRTSLHTDSNDCSHSSDLLTVQGLSKAVNGVESISETGGCSGQLSCHYRDVKNQVTFHEQHAPHGDKDPESSVTQEASVENTVSDCHGVQSQAGQGALLEVADGRLLLDPGTSPDSGVVHPTAEAGNITNEGATSTSDERSSKVEVMGQNIFDSGSPVQENLHASVLIFSQVPISVPLQSIQQHTNDKKAKRSAKVNGKKNGKIEENGCLSSDNSFEGTSQGLSSLLQDEKPSRNRSGQRKKDGSGRRKVTNQRSIVKASEDIQKWDRSPAEHSFLGITELVCCQGSLMSENCLENHALSDMGTRTAGLKSMIPENLSSSSIGKGQKLHGGKKSGARKSKLTESTSTQHRRRNVDTQKKDNMNNSMSRRKAKQKMVRDQLSIMEECQVHDAFNAEERDLSHLFSGIKKNMPLSKPDEPDKVNILQSDQLRDVDESNSGDKHASKYALSSLVASVNDDLAAKGPSHSLEGQILPKRSAWVRCDDCYKWRSIPVELADAIDETNCRWTCKDNSDKAFADCMIPQEKTNAQINAELEISDASCEEDSFTEPNRKGSEMKPAAAQQSSWVLVKSNIFLQRTCKTQTIDEVMVCQCKPPLDVSLGCGDECLNRMLNIECVPGTCPCGSLCSNQQFQKRRYAKFKWFRCGKKGFGLQLLEDVCQGQFLIEYVGEVLDLFAYEARQREYASRSQKHFYFMTLNGNEVIDACAKGNLGRFINHSCEPNCRTEKWMVNGEVCIGLFAIRDIKKGEEVTFDYNYVRVFGAAAKRCVCGSAECRGYIGGDPLNTEIIVQGDSDEEYPEPVMIFEDGETELNVDEIIPEATKSTDLPRKISVQSARKASKTPVVGPKVDITLQNDDAFLRSSSDGQLPETLPLASKNKTASAPFLDDNKCIPNTSDNNPYTSGPPPRTKSSRSSCSVKKKSCSSNKSVMQKGKKSSAIPLTQSAVCRTGHFEGVEEKLNELLDAQGGISKRRDATKGYLKLLFLTAASGDNVKSETSQSTRDLSLILDAILKTKSRTVLVDIINKNGLQMLHNIMKQNRKNFNKIPILRKLLKVLEFLAVKEMLTPEHINNIPSHAGVESFKESIIKLTYHNDIQVHQMARNFRDKWLPRTIRKVNLSDRENGWLNSKRANSNWFLPLSFKRSHIQGVRDTDAICVSRTDFDPSPSHGTDASSDISSFCSELASTSVPSVDMNSTVVAKPRKRKSRWDQPSDAPHLNSQICSIEEHNAEAIPKVMRSAVTQTESDSQCVSISEREAISLSDGIVSNNGTTPQGIEEVPPGFGPPASNSQPGIQSDSSMTGTEVVAGHPQERYHPRLTVSYGIPLALVEQLGTADAEARDNRHYQSWPIAPGMPFHPFPPLPPLPRGETSPAPGYSTKVVESREETRPTDSAPSQLHSSTTNVSVERPPMALENGAVNQHPKKMSWSPNGFGKRFFRSDRGNDDSYAKFGPPWPRERNGCRFRRSMRNGMSSVAVGNVQKKGRGSCFSEGARGENVSSTFSELPHQVQ